MIVDDKGRRVFAAANTRNVADAQLMFCRALKSLLEFPLEGRSATQVAAHVVTDFDFNRGRGAQMKVRIITGDGMDITNMETASFGDPVQIVGRKIMVLVLMLDVLEFLKDTLCTVFRRYDF